MIKLGDPLPLSLQLYDGAENKTVECLILDPDGKEINSVVLTPVAGGLYIAGKDQIPMPEFDFVMAVYIVMSNGVESKDYERASDVFLRDKEEVKDALEKAMEILDAKIEEGFKEEPPYYVGEVVSEKSDEFLEGKIDGDLET